MADIQTMRARDVIASKLAYCYLTVGSDRYLLMMAKKLEAKLEKEKQDVPILGRMSKGHKATSMNGTGSMTVYQVTSIFTDMVKKFQDTGEDTYFDIQVINEDPTSAAGRQTVILKDCNLDSTVIAAFDADSDDWLEQEMDFTFESFENPEKFTELDGVNR